MISNTSSTHGTPPVSATPERPRKAAAPAAAGSEVLTTPQAEQLRAALSASPEVRAEMVEQGLKLAVDPNYPPREIIASVAKLIIASEDLAKEE